MLHIRVIKPQTSDSPSSHLLDRKRLDSYEKIRQTLRNMSLVPEMAPTRECGNYSSSSCYVCHTTQFCTKRVCPLLL